MFWLVTIRKLDYFIYEYIKYFKVYVIKFDMNEII